MSNPAPMYAALLTLALGSACGGASPTTAPSPLAPATVVTSLRSPFPANSSFSLLGVSLSGTVSEVTSIGLVPLSGASVYCDACGDEGHSSVTTDANGRFTFSGDLSRGGGIWVAPGYASYLIVTKDGYQYPPGLPASMYPGPETCWLERIHGQRQHPIRHPTRATVKHLRSLHRSQDDEAPLDRDEPRPVDGGL